MAASLQETSRVRVTTDGEIALEAAFPDGPGIVVTSGSGSIAYARDARGQLSRTGGLGWRIGDEGSGYALGRAALQAVGQAAEGRGKMTALTDRLFPATGVASLDQLVKWSLSAAPRDVASLAREVISAADAGDEVAIELVDEAAVELALHVEALLPRLIEVRPLRVAFNGGILSSTSAVRRSLTAILEETQPELEIVEAPVDPPVGALRLADPHADAPRLTTDNR
jgi:N-acetylglucosamine kinase-like BadF-type ATPase